MTDLMRARKETLLHCLDLFIEFAKILSSCRINDKARLTFYERLFKERNTREAFLGHPEK
jgi:hypothetical protein